MKIKVNTVGYVDEKKYMSSTYVQHAGLIATILGIGTAVLGTVLKAYSYKLHVTDNAKIIDINDKEES